MSQVIEKNERIEKIEKIEKTILLLGGTASQPASQPAKQPGSQPPSYQIRLANLM